MTPDDLMHGIDYAPHIDVAGWIATEKLDGCRAYWDGAALWSRNGNPIKAPPELLAELPPGMPLDGELYGGPGTRVWIAAGMRTGRYRHAPKFIAFDAPAASGYYRSRHAALCAMWPAGRYLEIIHAATIPDIDAARHMLRVIQQVGGEGLMLYAPDQPYQPGRVDHLVKLKSDPIQ